MRWFAFGFVLGVALIPTVDRFDLGGDWMRDAVPFAWVFYANPGTWLVCEVLQRDELCVGLGFDGGPLEWLEHTWLYLSLGLMYGALAFGLRFIIGGVAMSGERLWARRGDIFRS